MYKHYIKLAFRDIIRRGFYSVVIIFSLATGLTCTNYIVAFVVNELSVDGFHEKKDRIYRLLADDPWVPGSKMGYVRKDAPAKIKGNYPEVEDFCRTFGEKVNKIIVEQHVFYDKINALATDKSFLNIFSYPFIEGNPKHALDSKDKIIITRKLASKFFGDKSTVGEDITLFFNRDTITFNVSGVIEDVSSKSHLNIDMIIPIENFRFDGSRAYLLLNPSADVRKLEKKLYEDRNNIPIIHDGKPGSYTLQKLNDIYFDKTQKPAIENSRNKNYVYIAATIGIIILVISLLNYLNLLASQLIDKQRVFGINRIVGGSNKHIRMQVLAEFGILIFISYDLSIVLTKFLFPYFNNLTDTALNVSYMFNPHVLIINAGILLVTGMITLLYTFFSLNRQKLSSWLSFSGSPVIKKKTIPLLVMIQFGVSVILIFSLITTQRQLNYIYSRDIGIDRNVIELRIPYSHRYQMNILKEQLFNNPAILAASVCAASPLLEHALVLLHYDKNDDSKTYSPAIFFGDEDYIDVLGIKLLEGRYFSSKDDKSSPKCIINQSLASMFDLSDPVGQQLPGADNEIIGLVEDFHFQSLENSVAPGYIAYTAKGGNILVKINQDNYQSGLNYVKQVWSNLIPDYPFECTMLGDQFDQMHADSGKFFRFIITFSLISILITCAGLLALTVYSTQIRIKEIGIRKVNGARTGEIIMLLSADYLKWLAIAIIIAFPLSYLVMLKWLQNFIYRIGISWWIFALAAIIISILVFLTVFWQSRRAAGKNPVEALRYE